MDASAKLILEIWLRCGERPSRPTCQTLYYFFRFPRYDIRITTKSLRPALLHQNDPTLLIGALREGRLPSLCWNVVIYNYRLPHPIYAEPYGIDPLLIAFLSEEEAEQVVRPTP